MVQDVSVSGVGILVVEDEHLQVGTVVSIRLEGIEGELVIRRLTRSNTPGLVLYGTEYTNTTGPPAHLFQERFMAPAKPLPQDFHDRGTTDEYDPDAERGGRSPSADVDRSMGPVSARSLAGWRP